jgi:hypothetical protein
LGQSTKKGNEMKEILLSLAMFLSLSTETFARHAGTEQDEKGLHPRCSTVLPQVDGSGRFYNSNLPEGKSYQATRGLPRRADQTRAIARVKTQSLGFLCAAITSTSASNASAIMKPPGRTT